jgi:GNAT superfamily N-acetyltransferase
MDDVVANAEAVTDAILRRAALPGGVRLESIPKEDWAARCKPITERVFADRPVITREDFLDEDARTAAERIATREGDARLHHRYGFFAGDEPVGFYEGRQDLNSAYAMCGTAILPEWQRKGIYSALLPRILEAARAVGFIRVVSRHHADNNAVLVAKLKQGFVINGFVLSVSGGLLVELVYYLHESARQRHRRIIGGT